jgi:hypothetical protein
MNETTLEQFALDPQRFLAAAQRERLLVTHNGKPLALVVGLENKDEEDLHLEGSPEFWRLIEERRREPTVRLKDIEADLFAGEDEPSGNGSSNN